MDPGIPFSPEAPPSPCRGKQEVGIRTDVTEWFTLKY